MVAAIEWRAHAGKVVGLGVEAIVRAQSGDTGVSLMIGRHCWGVLYSGEVMVVMRVDGSS